MCDIKCYNEACNWDGGECDEKYGKEGEVDISICAVGCLNTMVGDGHCDRECMRISRCNYDAGDCTDSFCAFECLDTMVNNGVCDQACRFSKEYDYDGADCKNEE